MALPCFLYKVAMTLCVLMLSIEDVICRVLGVSPKQFQHCQASSLPITKALSISEPWSSFYPLSVLHFCVVKMLCFVFPCLLILKMTSVVYVETLECHEKSQSSYILRPALSHHKLLGALLMFGLNIFYS